MPATTVTGEEIWKVLLKDREFGKQPKPMQELLRPYVEALPGVLDGLLGQPATLKTIMEAKYAFLQYALDNGLIEKSVEAQPAGVKEMFGDGMAEMIKGALQAALEMAKQISDDVPAILKQFGMTERQVLANPKLGMTKQMLGMYDKGELTIADVLKMRPMVILKITD